MEMEMENAFYSYFSYNIINNLISVLMFIYINLEILYENNYLFIFYYLIILKIQNTSKTIFGFSIT